MSIFDTVGIDVEQNDIETVITNYTQSVGVSRDTAVDQCVNVLKSRFDITTPQLRDDAYSDETTPVDALTTNQRAVTVIGFVEEFYNEDVDSTSVRQGLFGDESGNIKFNVTHTDIEELQRYNMYLIENAVTSSFDGVPELIFNQHTNIELLEEKQRNTMLVDGYDGVGGVDREDTPRGLPSPSDTYGDEPSVPKTYTHVPHDLVPSREYSGTVIAINENSGVVEQCPTETCDNVLDEGVCDYHGWAEPQHRNRTVAGRVIVQTGDDLIEPRLPPEIIDRVVDEDVSDIIENEHLYDTDPVASQLKSTFIGNEVSLHVRQRSNTICEITVSPRES
jgi:hypothetical protein